MAILLYAHSGSGNHGCEALVRTTVSLVDMPVKLMTSGIEEDICYQINEIAELCKDNFHPVHRQSLRYAIAATEAKLFGRTTLFTRFSRQDLLSHVNSGDLCLSIGGDNYCYAGTETLADLNTLLKAKGAKTVLWGCSIDSDAMTPEVIKDLKKYDLITVREHLTLESLAAAGITKNVKSVADSAFLLGIQEVNLPEGFVQGNTIGINLSPLILEYTDKKNEALASFYALVEHILSHTDSTIALIPHVAKMRGGDTEVLRPIFEKYKHTGRVILVSDQNCMRLKYIISKCRLFIGARTHSTIAAYSTCVPTLVIGYSVKSKGIAIDLFGSYENYVIPVNRIRSSADLIKAYEWLEEHEQEIKQILQTMIPRYQEKAMRGKAYLAELMQK